MKDFLPISLEEIKKRNWDSIDFLFINGDAYVDHPSFAGAVICRVLEAKGYKVAMLCQPDWRNFKNFAILGKPNYAVLICGGNLDSMLCHYTAARKKRSDDKYTPGGVSGKRPDHATAVYSQCIKKLWSDMPIIIGGIEASLRRFVHYDFWENALMPSILEDSGADLLVFGMGEKQIVEIADYLAGGASISDLHYIKGTAYACDKEEITDLTDFVELPKYRDIIKNRKLFATAYNRQADEQDPVRGKTIVQQGKNKFVVQNPPADPLTEKELDAVYDIEYQRLCHPSYNDQGGVPALDEVKFSIISSRGCFGSCSFCAIHAHQGRIIQARSHASILQEAKLLTTFPDFKGYIHDVGGPTANFRHPSCSKQLKVGTCKDRKCLFPEPCPNLDTDHSDYAKLLNEIRALPKIKKVFIRSGIRYDYLLCDKNDAFFKQLCEHHISGQLKIAP
ncbi:MAG: YgiQ family radical SAM protein, partial [Acidaminococcaceae bacterium]|nr:YgiQ family radical SAM protein [Acidaminococcaceae bacterium]